MNSDRDEEDRDEWPDQAWEYWRSVPRKLSPSMPKRHWWDRLLDWLASL